MCKSRAEREAQFHNHAFTSNVRQKASKFYVIGQSSKEYYHRVVERDCAGKQVLEYGCGTGSFAFTLAKRGAKVWGIDISHAGTKLATKKALELGVSDQTCFQVMDAEVLSFPDNSFDIVCGSGILHHLDLQKSIKEVNRVLKSGGRAVFFEPLGHNPLINLYRKLTPQMRSQDEKPLSVNDLKQIGDRFDSMDIHYFHLLSLASVALRAIPGFQWTRKVLEGIDQTLFRIAWFRKHAWIVVISLKKL